LKPKKKERPAPADDEFDEWCLETAENSAWQFRNDEAHEKQLDQYKDEFPDNMVLVTDVDHPKLQNL
jgi:hypothetical protein